MYRRATVYRHPPAIKVPRMLEKDGLSWKYDQGPNYWQNCIAVRLRNGIVRTLRRHNPTFSMRRQHDRHMTYWSSPARQKQLKGIFK
jgi:5-methylcytosine-specific restriction endonuclease McrA